VETFNIETTFIMSSGQTLAAVRVSDALPRTVLAMVRVSDALPRTVLAMVRVSDALHRTVL